MSAPSAAPQASPPVAGRLRSALRRGGGVLLGLFVLWQLAWIPAANLAVVAYQAAERIPGAPDGLRTPLERARAAERLAEASRQAQRVTRPWMDLTAQPQYWGLFAPDVNDQLSFPAVELVWADEAKHPRRWLPSDNEPPRPERFFRAGHFRLRRYELALSLTPPPHSKDFDPARDSWPATVAYTITTDYRVVGAYLRWRLMAFRQAHPDLPPPAQVVLWVQLYRIPEPPGGSPWQWEDLGRQPLARWRPYDGDPPRSQPLEVYDPVRGTFE
jgi:hypothetical protein